MRLLHTKTLLLHEFVDSDLPKYAILSHTWGNEEISFQEWRMSGGEGQDALSIMYRHLPAPFEQAARVIKSKAGYNKIKNFCDLCHQHGYTWAWVDTCCID